MNEIVSGGNAANEDTLVLRARYAPAKQPFVDSHTAIGETLQSVKSRLLNHFKLTEGSVDGGNKSYQLSFEDVVQTDLSTTVGSLAKHGKQLELLLVEQFTQG